MSGTFFPHRRTMARATAATSFRGALLVYSYCISSLLFWINHSQAAFCAKAGKPESFSEEAQYLYHCPTSFCEHIVFDLSVIVWTGNQNDEPLLPPAPPVGGAGVVKSRMVTGMIVSGSVSNISSELASTTLRVI